MTRTVSRPRHRSFRLTPPAHMVGKRLKPHLRTLDRLYWILTIGSAAACGMGVEILQRSPLGPQLPEGAWLLLSLGSIGVTMYLAGRLFGNVCHYYGLMTAEEAAALPVINGYNDAWLEPIADEEEQGDEEEEEEEEREQEQEQEREQATHRSATSAAMKR